MLVDYLGGRKHKENVRMYYQGWMEQQAQKLVDATARAFTQQRMLNPGSMPMMVSSSKELVLVFNGRAFPGTARYDAAASSAGNAWDAVPLPDDARDDASHGDAAINPGNAADSHIGWDIAPNSENANDSSVDSHSSRDPAEDRAAAVISELLIS